MNDSQMTCPKCHTTQPTSDTCMKCSIIIAKYREPSQYQEFDNSIPDNSFDNNNYGGNSQSNYGQSQSYNTESPTLFTPKIIVLSLLIIVGGYFFLSNGFYAPAHGSYNETTSMYINPRLGFKIEIPSDWNHFDAKDIMSSTGFRQFGDDFHLVASPYTLETGPLFIITKMRIEGEVIAGDGGWLQHSTEYADIMNATIEHSEIYEIGGLTVYSAGFRLGDNTYREDHMFITKKSSKPVNISFIALPGQEHQFREALDNITDSLKQTAFIEFY